MLIRVAIALLAAGTAFWIVGLFACLYENVRLFRRTPKAPPSRLPMTLIKPIKGLDDGLEENLESIAQADAAKALQVLIAIESDEDPAYPIASAFARRHPERDISVLLTGPCRGRMGKAHNMIEAFARAKHPRVIFSDSDVRTTAGLLNETARAFEDGCEAAFAVPQHGRGGGVGGVLLEAAMNHTFGLAAALSWRLVPYTHCAGAWMAYTRAAIERSGGLEPIAHMIADDLALSQRVAATGARARLIAAPAPLRETGTGLGETVRHLVKWSIIIRWSVPRLYLALPLFNLGLLALALLLCCELSGSHVVLGRALAGAAFFSRGFVALLQDALVGEGALPAPVYALLAFIDVGSTLFWLAGFQREIAWRGVRYRLSWGGRAEVLAPNGQPPAKVLS